ncbi:MAG: hypothetical protein AAFY11_16065 [Cyanobacteria bacterium J06641_5]
MRFSNPHFVEQRQRVLKAKNDTLERHFPKQRIRELYERYGPGTGKVFAEAFASKRDKMSLAFDLFLADLEPDSSLEDTILEAGRAFDCAHKGKDTFDIDIWVIADFLMGLELNCFEMQTHEQIADLIGSHIAKWLKGTPSPDRSLKG